MLKMLGWVWFSGIVEVVLGFWSFWQLGYLLDYEMVVWCLLGLKLFLLMFSFSQCLNFLGFGGYMFFSWRLCLIGMSQMVGKLLGLLDEVEVWVLMQNGCDLLSSGNSLGCEVIFMVVIMLFFLRIKLLLVCLQRLLGWGLVKYRLLQYLWVLVFFVKFILVSFGQFRIMS